jgi:hypothetical protein
MMERTARTSADLLEAFPRLTAIEAGKRFEVGDYGGDQRIDDSGILDVVFTDKQADTIWRLAGAHAATCMFIAIEQVRPDAAQRFHPMLERMCASNPSPLKGCREPSQSLVLRKKEGMELEEEEKAP